MFFLLIFMFCYSRFRFRNHKDANSCYVISCDYGHNDHYMISMGGQRPKVGGDWPLTGPYLQRCYIAICADDTTLYWKCKQASD